jgi:hypothetical protein
MSEVYDFNAGRAKRHEERAASFGSKPFKFGFKPREKDEGGNPVGPLVPEEFYVRANVGYMGIKRVAALSESSSGDETFSAIEYSVFSMIDPGDNALERFKQVVNNPDDPVTFDDLVELQTWLLTEQTSLPPTEPQPSAATPTPNGSVSTAPSSTVPGEASTS